jgi:dTDP-4-amino-4,6-dideoxygalactose transaminase
VHVPYTDFPAQFRQERDVVIRAIEAVFERGDFILGSRVAEFEAQFADLCECEFAAGVGSGTDALILALRAMEIGPGDEVITVPNSWISSASCIALVGARPVFVDVDVDMNVDPSSIEDAITERTRAILPVHLTGRPAKMDAILNIADRHEIVVIEDAAQAVGAKYKGRAVGGLGKIGCFSLHPLKNLNAAGDGGVVTCSDSGLAERLCQWRNHGLVDRDHAEFWGLCSRLDTIQAAILIPRMAGLNAVGEKRRETAHYYNERLRDLVQVPLESDDEHHVYHTYVIQTKRRDDLARHLAEKGISAKVHYPIPIHLQASCQEYGYRKGDFPVSERLSETILTLPVHQHLTDAQREYVADAVIDFFESGQK